MKKEFDAGAAELMSSAELASYLNGREAAFAKAYIRTGNASAAAIEAGYSPKRKCAEVQGSRLKNKPEIIAYRRALIRESVQDFDLTKDNILLKLTNILQRCMQQEPVMAYDKDRREMVETGQYVFDAKGAIRAIAEIVKLLGMDAPIKIENTGAGALERFLLSFEKEG